MQGPEQKDSAHRCDARRSSLRLRSPLLLQAGFTFSSVASSLNLGVSFTGQMSIRGFPFIQLRVLTGSLSVSPNPLAITAASLRVEGTLLQTNITTELVYEAKRGIFGMEVSVDSFSLQVGCPEKECPGGCAVRAGRAPHLHCSGQLVWKEGLNHLRTHTLCRVRYTCRVPERGVPMGVG